MVSKSANRNGATMLALLALASAHAAGSPVIPQAQPAKYYEQKLDHFNAEAGTWTQRYYMDDR